MPLPHTRSPASLRQTGRHTAPRQARSGQAMVELVVALIAILVVTAGMFQLVLMGTAHTETLTEAAAQAASGAVSGAALAQTFTPVADWNAGPDGMRQTPDDIAERGSLAGARSGIAALSVPNADWSAIDPARFRSIAEFHHGALPSTTFALVRGEAAREVDVLPVARALFGLRDPTEIRNEVWMTLTGGLY